MFWNTYITQKGWNNSTQFSIRTMIPNITTIKAPPSTLLKICGIYLKGRVLRGSSTNSAKKRGQIFTRINAEAC